MNRKLESNLVLSKNNPAQSYIDEKLESGIKSDKEFLEVQAKRLRTENNLLSSELDRIKTQLILAKKNQEEGEAEENRYINRLHGESEELMKVLENNDDNYDEQFEINDDYMNIEQQEIPTVEGSAALKEENNALVQELNKVCEKYESLLSELNKRERPISISQALEEESDRLVNLRNQEQFMAKLQYENSELEATLNQMQDENNKLLEKLNEISKKYDDLMRDNESMQPHDEHSNIEKEKTLLDTIKSQNEIINELERQNTELEIRFNKLQEETDPLVQDLSEDDERRKQQSKGIEKHRKINLESKPSDSENSFLSTLKSQNEMITELGEKNHELELGLNKLQEENYTISDKLNEVSQKYDSLLQDLEIPTIPMSEALPSDGSLLSKFRYQNEIIRELEAKNADLLVNLNETQEKSNFIIQKANEAEERSNLLLSDLETARKLIDESRSSDKEDALLSTLRCQNEMITELRNKNDDFNSKFEATMQENDALAQELQKTQEEYDTVLKDLEHLKNAYSEAADKEITMLSSLRSQEEIIQQLASKNSEIEPRLKQSQEESNYLSSELDKSQEQCKLLRADLEGVRESNAKFEVQKGIMLETIRSTNAAMVELTEKNIQLEDRINKAQYEINTLAGVSEESKEQSNLLLEDLEVKRRNIDEFLEKENSHIGTIRYQNQLISDLENKISELESRFRGIQEDNNGLTKDLSKAKEKCNLLMNTLEADKKLIEESVERENTILAKSNSQNSIIAGLEKKNSELEAKYNKIREEDSNFTIELNKSNSIVDSLLKELEVKRKTNNEFIEKQHNLLETLRSQNDAISELESKNNELELKIIEYNQENNTLIQELNAAQDIFESQNDAANELKSENNKLKSKLIISNQENDALTAELYTVNDKCESQIYSINELEAKNNEFALKLFQFNQENNTLIEELNKVNDKCNSLQSELEAREKSTEYSREKELTMLGTLRSQNDMINDLGEKIHVLESKLHKSQEENSIFLKENQEGEEKYTSLLKNLETRRKINDEFLPLEASLQSKLKTQDELISELTTRNAELESILNKLQVETKKMHESPEDSEARISTRDEERISEKESELLTKLKFQSDAITELENKNLDLESRFNRIRNKNNLLESSTKKYSENVEKVFRDVNKKLLTIEKHLAAKEEKIQSIYKDYNLFKGKYIDNFREKSRVFIEQLCNSRVPQDSSSPLVREESLDKDEIIKLLKERIEYLEDKIEALVKSNYATKEIIENISDQAHDAIESIKVDR